MGERERGQRLAVRLLGAPRRVEQEGAQRVVVRNRRDPRIGQRAADLGQRLVGLPRPPEALRQHRPRLRLGRRREPARQRGARVGLGLGAPPLLRAEGAPRLQRRAVLRVERQRAADQFLDGGVGAARPGDLRRLAQDRRRTRLRGERAAGQLVGPREIPRLPAPAHLAGERLRRRRLRRAGGRAVDLLRLDQQRADDLDRHGEVDVLPFGQREGRHADDPPLDVEQRPPRTARTDRRRHLHQLGPALVEPPPRGDDPVGDGEVVAARMADGDDARADRRRRGREGERRRGEPDDPQHGDVGRLVLDQRLDRGEDRPFVGPHERPPHAAQHVGAGHDQPRRSGREPRAERRVAAALDRAEDLHDRRTDPPRQLLQRRRRPRRRGGRGGRGDRRAPRRGGRGGRGGRRAWRRRGRREKRQQQRDDRHLRPHGGAPPRTI